MTIGELLREARLQSGMTQEGVAEAIGVSRQSVSNWENDKTYPDVINIIRLSDLYQVSLDVLLKGSEDYMGHLDESTDIVKSNRNLIRTIVFGVLLIVLILFISPWLALQFVLSSIFTITLALVGIVYFEIISRF
ncbi:helix-turn-helix transcriptional regulator [Aerococcus sp. UMB7834]|uniref:helix-turn-helix domain-containing protein n=1 Tax=Aerococcus sp. UMB7834 TaxID=3046342 RepID=UPI00254ACC41|nr:helix-turn-helix transcriptional regulator [Aerococcus sp. UMB7834]MDK6805416.1 helix-turn-helix transcriptional regulator [Aerococcus sp. UMB7834]